MKHHILAYSHFDPKQEGLREALCTLGNGYFCTRGAAPESSADEIHYPGTYLAGGYNRLSTEIAGRTVENEDLVNMPNWLPLTFRIVNDAGEGDWFSLRGVEILSFHQELDITHGVLHRRIHFRDAHGRETRLCEKRLVSMHNPHLAALETTLTAENWSGRLMIKSALDGTVINHGVERYRDLKSRHLDPVESRTLDERTLYLKVRTSQSEIAMAQAARLRIFHDGREVETERRTVREPGYIAQETELDVEKGSQVILEKTVALYTSRDNAISECGLEACTEIDRAPGFQDLSETQRETWLRLWRRFGFDLETDVKDANHSPELVLHLHIFHLLQTVSPNSIDLDIGVPARGWHGEAYRGHIFWDELFIFPFLNLSMPEITEELLKYRYRRMKEARHAAIEQGFEGIMFPWQSGSNGREETQKLHLNPESGRWIPDTTHRQRHVNAAIAYNVWQYYQATGDMDFLNSYGAEMLVEIARFWASTATYNEELDRYEIRGVMGPDEFHTAYPGQKIVHDDQEGGGLDNNAYTNVMAVWVLCRALEILDIMQNNQQVQLREKLDISNEEIERWQKISRRMRLIFLEEDLISQFEGYEELKEFPFREYEEKYGDIQRTDRILEAEGDSTNRYKISKQADVLMLFYLFSSEELHELFDRLDYPFEYNTIPRNIRYYIQRTSHGSTLSRVVHAWVLSRSNRRRSWELFCRSLESDVSDIQGGTTREGIHLGAMAGTVDMIQRCYTGLVIRNDILWFNPQLPEDLISLKFNLHYRYHSLALEFSQDTLKVTVRHTIAGKIKVGFKDRVFELEAGDTKTFSLGKADKEAEYGIAR